MKRVVIVHGWEGYPGEGWQSWLKKKLEKRGFEVFTPAMPDALSPTMGKWVPYLARTIGVPDENCYLVGHSLGCITILRYLETLERNQRIGGAVLVAGFGTDLDYKDYKGELRSFFSTPVNWQEIKKHCQKFVAIHSDNDPWIPLKHSALFKEKLDAKTIIEHNMKHFSGDENILELPSALNAVLEMAK